MARFARYPYGVWAVCALMLGVGALAQAQSLPPSEVGQWSSVKSWPVPAVHAHLLPTGKVMFFSEFEAGDDGPYLWDPVADQLQQLPPPGYNIFCAGHSFLPDGRLLIAGGHIDTDRGLPDAILFDPFNLSWTRQPDMAQGRWYPTNTTLPNGEVLVTAGATESGTHAPIPEVWSPATGWRRLTGASRTLPYYPWMFVAPNGKLFMAGPEAPTPWLDASGTGAWVTGPRTRYGAKRGYGSAVMYDVGKVLIVGGNAPPTNSAEVIDLNQSAPAWRVIQPMSYVRRQHNATLLPDGSVLVTGGHSGAVLDDATRPRLETELWNPLTERWSQLAPMGAYRGYHSVAVLLPDGRVLSAGGRRVKTMQVFSPPYLFKGSRPVILSTLENLAYGQTFSVSSAQAASIAQVTLVRLGSVTHSFDENQRFLRMNFSAGSGTLTVTAPANATVAPPGHYMLFLVDGRGVPSVARIVKLGVSSTPPPPPPPPPPGDVAISFGSTWNYDDSGMDPGTAWTLPGFDDSGWPVGTAQLGYGDGDEKTVLRKTAPSQPSLYFRKKLHVMGTVDAATLKVLFDDGIAVWINGTQVFSRNVTNTAHSAYASQNAPDNTRAEASIPPSVFLNGENTVAVMVKQGTSTSSDVSFDLELALSVSSSGGHQAALMLERPTGGESFHVGAAERIRWLSHGHTSGRVDLEYSTNGGKTWRSIARGVPDTENYDWRIPAEDSAQALVRVIDSEMTEVVDMSKAPFTLSTAATYVAVPFGDDWSFDDRNVDPGPAWTSASFDDSAWRYGTGQFGYGDEDEHTVLRRTSPAQPSVYFRKSVSLTGKPSAARLRVLADDGFALWVNGRLVTSRNVGSTAHAALSTGSAENTLFEADLDASAFVAGENTLAVMVKQRAPESSDVSFDLELSITGP